MTQELTYQERYLDGTIRVHPGYRVKNNSDTDIVFGPVTIGPDGERISAPRSFNVLREQAIFVGKQRDGSPKYANRYHEQVIPAKGEAVVPEDVLNELVALWCATCNRPARFARATAPWPKVKVKPPCTNPAHRVRVMGGIAPNIIILEGAEIKTTEVAAALTAPEPTPQFDLAELERRVLARVASKGVRT
jgi:hypothetical protein